MHYLDINLLFLLRIYVLVTIVICVVDLGEGLNKALYPSLPQKNAQLY